jgi:nucleotide-binding universal stress UspA family protein
MPMRDIRLIDLSALERQLEDRSRAACRAGVDHFQAAASAAGVYAGASVERITLYAVDDVVARRARTHDLCIVPLATPYDGQSDLVEQLIFQSGRPVLALPAERPKVATDRVVVAWDGSRSAARALADALPILQRAGAVRVVTFLNEKEAATPGLGGDVVRHLQAHGVASTAVEVDVAGRRIGAALDDYFAGAPADLVVMGAYGHSRLRQFVLGGATSHMLREPKVPLMLSH